MDQQPEPTNLRPKRLAVILAGGEGSRLKSLTRLIAGDERPKQFCPILVDRTLLDETRSRVALRIGRENTFFSLTEKHARFYERPLWNVTKKQLIVQPANRGTSPALLYSLMRLANVAPNSAVAFFPSDHYFADNGTFMESVESAFGAAEMNPGSVVLLGIEPEIPETSYGWIEPAQSFFGDLPLSVSRVEKFWEKPALGVAKSLMAAGCLWNSFVMVGRVESFLDLFREHLPHMYRMFAAARTVFGSAQEGPVISSIYSWIGESNFSTEVLERSAERLLVMRVPQVGWSDWGEPQRVLGTLNGLGVQPEWMPAAA